jgi:hypothetical protein
VTFRLSLGRSFPSLSSHDWAEASVRAAEPTATVHITISEHSTPNWSSGRLIRSCERVIRDFNQRFGTDAPSTCALISAAIPQKRFVLSVNNAPRVAGRLEKEPIRGPRTFTGLGLPLEEQIVVRALEDVLADDPGLLLGATSIDSTDNFSAVPTGLEMRPDLARAVLRRGASLHDRKAVSEAVARSSVESGLNQLLACMAVLCDPTATLTLYGDPGPGQKKSIEAGLSAAFDTDQQSLSFLVRPTIQWLPMAEAVGLDQEPANEGGCGEPQVVQALPVKGPNSSPVYYQLSVGPVPWICGCFDGSGGDGFDVNDFEERVGTDIRSRLGILAPAWNTAVLAGVAGALNWMLPRTMTMVTSKITRNMLTEVGWRMGLKALVSDFDTFADVLIRWDDDDLSSLIAAFDAATGEARWMDLVDEHGDPVLVEVAPQLEDDVKSLSSASSLRGLDVDLIIDLLRTADKVMLEACELIDLQPNNVLVVSDSELKAAFRRLLGVQHPELSIIARTQIPGWASPSRVGVLEGRGRGGTR